MIGVRLPSYAAALCCALAVGGCGGELAADRANGHQAGSASPSGYMTGGGGLFSLGVGQGSSAQAASSGLAVNAYLWRGALETLKFMPLASADPFGGVIITDWWTPPSSAAERFKATAYILSRQLRTDGIKMSLFRQVQQGGQWVDAPVDPSKPAELEDLVLAKARELRSEAGTAQ